MTHESKDSRDLLNDAIREVSGQSATTRSGAEPRAASRRNLSIEEALREQKEAKSDTVGRRATEAKHSELLRPVDASLDAALAKVGAGDTATRVVTPVAPATTCTAASLAAAVSGTGIAMPAQDSTQGNSAAQRRLLGIVVFVFVMIAAGGYWWSQQRLTGAAAVLHDLAAAVEQHRTKNSGQLPPALATLEGFPKGAVEWPLRYWKARDAAGRTEIVWVLQGKGQGSHYRILLRQGNEVWTVSDRDANPKLLKTGNP